MPISRTWFFFLCEYYFSHFTNLNIERQLQGSDEHAFVHLISVADKKSLDANRMLVLKHYQEADIRIGHSVKKDLSTTNLRLLDSKEKVVASIHAFQLTEYSTHSSKHMP